MATVFKEKRKHSRAYFSPEDKVRGVFLFPDFAQVSFSAPVIDLGMGGLHFVVKREELNALVEGSRLVLAELSLGGERVCEQAVDLTVRRVFDHPMVSNVSLACQFEAPTLQARQALEALITSRLQG